MNKPQEKLNFNDAIILAIATVLTAIALLLLNSLLQFNFLEVGRTLGAFFLLVMVDREFSSFSKKRREIEC